MIILLCIDPLNKVRSWNSKPSMWSGQGASTYGGVEEVILGEKRITFRMSPSTARELGTEEMIEVQLSAENYDLHQFEQFLFRLFEREPGVVIKRET